MSKSTTAFDIELFFNALADRTRLRLINLMGKDEVCVCFFVEVLGANQPKISRHLAYLRRAGIVETRKEGLWMHYRVTEPKNEDAARIWREVQIYLSNDKEMQRDRRRLVKVCCADKLPASVEGAPLPASLTDIRCHPKCWGADKIAHLRVPSVPISFNQIYNQIIEGLTNLVSVTLAWPQKHARSPHSH